MQGSLHPAMRPLNMQGSLHPSNEAFMCKTKGRNWFNEMCLTPQMNFARLLMTSRKMNLAMCSFEVK